MMNGEGTFSRRCVFVLTALHVVDVISFGVDRSFVCVSFLGLCLSVSLSLCLSVSLSLCLSLSLSVSLSLCFRTVYLLSLYDLSALSLLHLYPFSALYFYLTICISYTCPSTSLFLSTTVPLSVSLLSLQVSETMSSHHGMLVGEMWKLEVKQQSSSWWVGRKETGSSGVDGSGEGNASQAPGGKADMQRTADTIRSVLQVVMETDEPPQLLGIDLTPEFRRGIAGFLVGGVIAVSSYVYEARQDKGDPYGRERLDY